MTNYSCRETCPTHLAKLGTNWASRLISHFFYSSEEVFVTVFHGDFCTVWWLKSQKVVFDKCDKVSSTFIYTSCPVLIDIKHMETELSWSQPGFWATSLTCMPYLQISVFVFLLLRMWGQYAGQQRELLLPWFPQWILSLHALHLENISHTRRKGMGCLES